TAHKLSLPRDPHLAETRSNRRDDAVGDDWTVAVAMLLALVTTGILAADGVPAVWLVPMAAIVMTGVSLSRTARRHPSE
ncbi:MAG TPA: hypothetical protein VNF91_08375, partial [Candidatus Acidoferrum sp.]|nr:hypothetical protein [Candidatus Acidoferrum sp.]